MTHGWRRAAWREGEEKSGYFRQRSTDFFAVCPGSFVHDDFHVIPVLWSRKGALYLSCGSCGVRTFLDWHWQPQVGVCRGLTRPQAEKLMKKLGPKPKMPTVIEVPVPIAVPMAADPPPKRKVSKRAFFLAKPDGENGAASHGQQHPQQPESPRRDA